MCSPISSNSRIDVQPNIHQQQSECVGLYQSIVQWMCSPISVQGTYCSLPAPGSTTGPGNQFTLQLFSRAVVYCCSAGLQEDSVFCTYVVQRCSVYSLQNSFCVWMQCTIVVYDLITVVQGFIVLLQCKTVGGIS